VSFLFAGIGWSSSAHVCWNVWRLGTRIGLVSLAFVWSAHALASRGAGGGGSQSEYAVKAAFLLNFAKFIEWPPSAFASAGAPIVIGVLGSDPFGPQLEAILEGKTVEGRRLQSKRVNSASAAEGIHMLFVPASSVSRMGELASLRGKPVLLVGESPGFAQKHGHIGFYMEKGRIAFEVHVSRAKTTGANISSRLLQLARIVQ
jgi:hypothetical protein